MRRRLVGLFGLAGLGLLLAFAAGTQAHAQALYAGTGPGSYVALGFSGSAFKSDYGKRTLGGATVYLDSNLYRRVGLEVEYRTLRFHTDEDVRQSTYLAGPRISTHGRNLRPYVRLLAGRGKMEFPYGYATGSYLVAAPGAGLDVRLGGGRVLLRLADFEYQVWPGFTYGEMHPYGLSSGVSFDVMRVLHPRRGE